MNGNRLKISVITPVFNGEDMIRSCMHSVGMQTYGNKEHVIVDGLSTDNTVAVINANTYGHVKLISEKDSGLYDAFNKGIRIAEGDVICFLSADDMYAHENVLQSVADTFLSNEQAQMVYGDIVYVERRNLSKVVRYWKSSSFKNGLFRKGWMAPNTALFIRKEVFYKYGVFELKYKLASDYELQYRFFQLHQLNSLYLPGIMVRMRSGGLSNSSMSNIYQSLSECRAALRSHRVPLGWLPIMNTLLYRLRQTRIPAEIQNLNNRQLLSLAEAEVFK
jgi:glycosyltransferase involved in cell wall biosynthesis